MEYYCAGAERDTRGLFMEYEDRVLCLLSAESLLYRSDVAARQTLEPRLKALSGYDCAPSGD